MAWREGGEGGVAEEVSESSLPRFLFRRVAKDRRGDGRETQGEAILSVCLQRAEGENEIH